MPSFRWRTSPWFSRVFKLMELPRYGGRSILRLPSERGASHSSVRLRVSSSRHFSIWDDWTRSLPIEKSGQRRLRTPFRDLEHQTADNPAAPELGKGLIHAAEGFAVGDDGAYSTGSSQLQSGGELLARPAARTDHLDFVLGQPFSAQPE